MLRSVLRSFTLSRALLVFFAALGYFLLSPVHEGISVPLNEPAPWIISVWYQWDANWYMSIVTDGYQWLPGSQSNVAFFPLYPLSVKLIGSMLDGRYLLAGLMLSTVSFLFAMFFLYKLVRIDFDEETARRAVLLLAIFPTSLFFTTLYTESLFLMTSLATFYYARKGRWALAGGWGLLSALTRVTGLWLLLPLAWEFMSQKKFSVRMLSPSWLWLTLVPGGTGLYMLYLYFDFGYPLAFAETQLTGWGHGFTPVWTSLSRDLAFLLEKSEPWVVYELAASSLLFLCIVVGLKKLPGSFNIYMLITLLMPLLGGTSKSMSRYMVVVFPVFISMALLTKKPAVRYIVYALSLTLLGISTAAFVSGRWVA